ncbi:hypothetical protein JG687_00003148 [Phytophthora cactorum]|uniref:Uncharacterized protein n=1 Tax=Phytophthora cactorum TaxID=29920 RepID=A0A8T1USE0_9STRA|nr:hypothetical protein PC128_g7323 [Phytophthora cactorum]KAG4058473.1 hypothetical protein PC123_g6549 [Phytophthora cactorum]KAG6969569.1 hypothetical protein JG687_00003148 [Phytophthora cactorum]
MALEQALISGHVRRETATETVARRVAILGDAGPWWAYSQDASAPGAVSAAVGTLSLQVMQDAQVICYSTFFEYSTGFIACYW